MTWKRVSHYLPFVRGIQPSSMLSLHDIRPVMWNCGMFFVVSLNKLLKKHSSCWWFETQCRSCGVTLILFIGLIIAMGLAYIYIYIYFISMMQGLFRFRIWLRLRCSPITTTPSTGILKTWARPVQSKRNVTCFFKIDVGISKTLGDVLTVRKADKIFWNWTAAPLSLWMTGGNGCLGLNLYQNTVYKQGVDERPCWCPLFI